MKSLKEKNPMLLNNMSSGEVGVIVRFRNNPTITITFKNNPEIIQTNSDIHAIRKVWGKGYQTL